ncbi:hypothetical protein [Nonomuraea sp. SBT364]|uniref:hypothetical protein n=1 Tax=Nonomuraea sp. SBT364 TaxID=1580530 RepID=UPI00066C620A|nr:hypothetical protein [Nonomuraea sp. SBT364]
MDIHKHVIRSAAEAFDLEREELGRFVGEVAGELEAIGAFWGDDDLGVTFVKGEGGGSGYEAVTGQLMAGADVLVNAHREIAGRLGLMKDNVQVGDWNLVAVILSRLPPADPDRPVWGTR